MPQSPLVPAIAVISPADVMPESPKDTSPGRFRMAMLLVTLIVVLAATIVWQFRGMLRQEYALFKQRQNLEKFAFTTIMEGLESPWALEFMPDGRLLLTERPGRLHVIDLENPSVGNPLEGVPEVIYEGQGGMLDVALAPDGVTSRPVYLSYTVRTPEDMMTRISRFKLDGNALVDQQVVFAGVPGSGKAKHFGNRMVFGNDGKLYFTLGERGKGKKAQDLGNLNGKTIRLNPDGTVPEDNPFIGETFENEDGEQVPVRPEIFTYGNRNSQGLAVHRPTGKLFSTEHGPSWNDAPGGGDEINILEAGKNYGWPEIHHEQTAPGMEHPDIVWNRAIAPSGCDFFTPPEGKNKLPGWEGDFFFTTLRGRTLYRVDVAEDGTISDWEEVFSGVYGRLRDVETGPDGALYFITSDTDAYGPGREGGDRLVRMTLNAQ